MLGRYRTRAVEGGVFYHDLRQQVHHLKACIVCACRMIITLVEYFDSKYPPVHKPWEHEA